MEFINTKTYSNLLKLYKGCAISKQRFQLYKELAIEEGYHQIGNIFSSIVTNEITISNIWCKYLEMISYTNDNLLSSITNLKEEINVLEEYCNDAIEDGYNKIAFKFKEYIEIKSHQIDLLESLYRNIDNKEVFEKKKEVEWRCMKCGYIYKGYEACARCSLCNAEQGYFYNYIKLV